MNLSPNFTLDEFINSPTAEAYNLSNMPNSLELDNLRALARNLEQVRALFGKAIHINSAFRSEAVNKRVGGVSNSDHRLGFAADFTIKGFSLDDIFARIRATESIRYDQLIREPTWIHFSIAPRMRRQDLLAYRNKAGKMVYEPAPKLA